MEEQPETMSRDQVTVPAGFAAAAFIAWHHFFLLGAVMNFDQSALLIAPLARLFGFPDSFNLCCTTLCLAEVLLQPGNIRTV